MSRYRLRGQLELFEEPDSYSRAYEPGSLSTDYHWELGYSPIRFTYFAELYDDDPDYDDPDFPVPPGARVLVRAIGERNCSVDSVEQLQAEMKVDLPPAIVAALDRDREFHFTGRLGERADQVRRRWLLLRGIELRRYLREVGQYLGPVTQMPECAADPRRDGPTEGRCMS